MKTFTLALLLILPFQLCAADLKDRDASLKFLNEIQKHHEDSIAAAQLAIGRAMNPQIKTFSENLVKQEQALVYEIENEKRRLPDSPTPVVTPTNGVSIADVARKVPEITPQGNISTADINSASLPISKLGNMTGPEFDKLYTESLSTSDTNAADLAKKAANEIENPIVKDLARRVGDNLETQKAVLGSLTKTVSDSTQSSEHR